MLKVGDKVIIVSASKFQKKFFDHIGIIDEVRPKDEYCYHISFKNSSLNEEAVYLMWSQDNVKLLEMTDEEYSSLEDNVPEEEETSIEEFNPIKSGDEKKYGLNYVYYTKVIAVVELGVSVIYALVNWASASQYSDFGDINARLLKSFKSTAGTLSLIGGVVIFVLLMLFATMAENLAYIRKNSEKDQ